MNAFPIPALEKSFQIEQPRLGFPVVHGVISRRILVNFRCAPQLFEGILPKPFRPNLVRGFGLVGICLIRLAAIRPAWCRDLAGHTSENAAYRIAVVWNNAGTEQEGVFIPRRDTNSRLIALLGGRLFPGFHHHARFEVNETPSHLTVNVQSEDGTRIEVAARTTAALAANSVFPSLNDASVFFQRGSVGWSTGRHPASWDCLELQTFNWTMEPLAVEHAESSFLNAMARLPFGSLTFDSAFLMRNVGHRWLNRGRLRELNPRDP